MSSRKYVKDLAQYQYFIRSFSSVEMTIRKQQYHYLTRTPDSRVILRKILKILNIFDSLQNVDIPLVPSETS